MPPGGAREDHADGEDHAHGEVDAAGRGGSGRRRILPSRPGGYVNP